MAESFALWLYDLERGVSSPLIQTEGEYLVADPVWAPGDTALVFGVCLLGPVEALTEASPVPVDDCVRATDWSPDGRHLLVEVGIGYSLAYSAARSVAAYDFAEGTARRPVRRHRRELRGSGVPGRPVGRVHLLGHGDA